MAFEKRVDIRTSMKKIAESEQEYDKILKDQKEILNESSILPKKEESCDDGKCNCNRKQ